ncbi:MAG: AAA domain-containing protein [bacterium]|nr:AAA domain-containing protein [bacterium]
MDTRSHEQILLETATSLGGAHEAHELARGLCAALAALPDTDASGPLRLAGMNVFDHERRMVDRFTVAYALDKPLRTAPEREVPVPHHEEVPIERSEASLFQPGSPTYLSPDLAAEHGAPLPEELYRSGVRRYVSTPMEHHGGVVGSVFAGIGRSDPVDAATVQFIEQLARVAAPVLWSCTLHARFARGDRRRDMLLAVAGAINTGLKVDAVIDCGRMIIAQLPDVALIQIDLLDDEHRTFSSHRYLKGPADTEEASLQPQTVSVDATAMCRLVADNATYESEALASECAFEADAELRALGVKRYVLAPMVVRGRLLGGLLVGLSDPHPSRDVDRWVYENLALQLGLAISNARQHEQLQRLSDRLREQNVYLREEIQSQHDFSEMVGKSEAMIQVNQEIARVAPTDATVLITGETGVGKELVARAVHAHSPRSEHPMVKVNCAAIPEGMVESELFGHERGAFTSAVARRIGRFELAHEGTLYLDEVGELPLGLQAKLLRVLQDGEFERVGGTQTLVSNARIIAATNRDIHRAVETGIFRADLFYRISVFPIHIPSLDARREDVHLLVEHFVAQFSRPMGRRIESIDPASMDYLVRRDWPGNIRELRHVIERAMILCEGPCLRVEATPAGAPQRPTEPKVQTADTLPPLRAMEAEHIQRALRQTGGVIQGPHGAAGLLGIKPSTLRFRIKRLGIPRRG